MSGAMQGDEPRRRVPAGRGSAAGLLVLLCAVVTLVNQNWVGDLTIYADGEIVAEREAMHAAVLANRPVGATWSETGANGVNIRIGSVFLAEAVRSATGMSVRSTYKLLDTAFLFVSLLALWAFLRGAAGARAATVGLLYVAAVLPLTYHFQTFHPWDRASLFCWLVALLLLQRGQVIPFALVSVLGVVVKMDIAILPGLYFLLKVTRRDWLRVSAATSAMAVATLGTYALLRVLRPGGFDATLTIAEQVATNLEVLIAWPQGYPPLLAFLVPAGLAAWGFRSGTRFERSCFAFALGMLAFMSLTTNFHEVRAHMPAMALTLPLALRTLGRMEGDGAPPRTA